jgi:hypothetical protein
MTLFRLVYASKLVGTPRATQLVIPSEDRHRRRDGPVDVPEKKNGYRIVAICLYSHEAADADRVTKVLQETGWPRANRSLVVREALARLFEDIAGKEPEAIFNYFLERRAKRAMRRPDKSS